MLKGSSNNNKDTKPSKRGWGDERFVDKADGDASSIG